MRWAKFTCLTLTTLVTALAFASPASATHSGAGLHWARSANPFSVALVDQTSYDTELAVASGDWSQSDVLDAPIATSCPAGNPKRHGNPHIYHPPPVVGCSTVSNGRYGINGWLGVATVWYDPATLHIQSATVQLNDSYLIDNPDYDTVGWHQYVMCQEIGHTFGLDHQDVDQGNLNLGTCMDYTNDPSRDDGAGNNEHPNPHDYEELDTIYAHIDSPSSSGRTATVTYTILTPS